MNLITREQFEVVRVKLESSRKATRPRIHDLYDVVCAILYKERHAIPWRKLPDVFPKWRTVHEYHLQWGNERVEGGGTLLDQVLGLLK